MSETRLNRAIAGAGVLLILLFLAALLNPLLASPGDPPAATVTSQVVSNDPVTDSALAHQAVTADVVSAVHVQASQAHAAVLAAQAAAEAKAKAAAAAAPPAAPPAPVAAPVSGTDYAASAFGQCVRSREQGGSYAWGPGNGGGAYQFLYSTWVRYGGAGSMYGNAGPAYQDQVFNNAVAINHGMDWTPYDGCVL